MSDLGGLPVPEMEPEHGPDLKYGFNAHEWGVLLPLSLVGLFLNYDTGLLSLAAPDIADGLGVSVATFGIGVAVIRLAALASMPVLRLADRLGRRQMLLVSVLAFTVATAATSLAWGLVAFRTLRATPDPSRGPASTPRSRGWSYIVSAKLTSPSPRSTFFRSLPLALRGSLSVESST